jgi:hypothetical protein
LRGFRRVKAEDQMRFFVGFVAGVLIGFGMTMLLAGNEQAQHR